MKKGYNLAKIFKKKIQMYFLCKQRLTGGYHSSQFILGAECAALNGIWTVNRVFMISGSNFFEANKRKIVEKRDSHAWSILTSLHANSCLN